MYMKKLWDSRLKPWWFYQNDENTTKTAPAMFKLLIYVRHSSSWTRGILWKLLSTWLNAGHMRT